MTESGRNAWGSAEAALEGDFAGAANKAAKSAGGLATGTLGAAASGLKAGNNLRRGVLRAAEDTARDLYDPLGDAVVVAAELTGGSADD